MKGCRHLFGGVPGRSIATGWPVPLRDQPAISNQQRQPALQGSIGQMGQDFARIGKIDPLRPGVGCSNQGIKLFQTRAVIIFALRPRGLFRPAVGRA